MSEWEYTDLCPQDGLEIEEAKAIVNVLNAAMAWAQPPGETRHRLADIDLYEAVKALRAVEDVMGDMLSCGDTVWYYPVIGRCARSLHRIEALSVEHGREVAWLEGKSGYVLRTHLFYPTEHEEAERAVIEAAKEEAENTKRNGGWTPLLAAVEALREVEDK